MGRVQRVPVWGTPQSPHTRPEHVRATLTRPDLTPVMVPSVLRMISWPLASSAVGLATVGVTAQTLARS